MRKTTRAHRIVAAMPILLLLAGCATTANPAPSSEASLPTSSPTAPPVASTPPTPSSTPAGPPLGDLVLSPDGLGSLEIGEPIDPVLATFDPEGCKTEQNQDYYPPDDPIFEAYLPNYPKSPSATSGSSYDYYPFEPHHDDAGRLEWLAVRSPELRTAAGIGLGSTKAELLAAYPGAEAVDGPNATAYGIAGDRGRLVLEVSTEDRGATGARAGTVFMVRVEPLNWELRSLSSTDSGGFCPMGA